jgi:hypothetical protein
MMCMALEPEMFPEPSIWRRYHSPRVSPSMEVFSKVAMPVGKCPQMMTVLVHTLRMRLHASARARNSGFLVLLAAGR